MKQRALRIRSPRRLATLLPAIVAALVVLAGSVSAQTITITSTSPLPNAMVGASYTFQFGACCTTSPLSWSLTGSLPNLTLNSAGVLSGTPTTSGTFSFSVSATPPEGSTVSRSFQLTIDPALAVTTTSPLPGGSVGVPYNSAIVATGGTPPYFFSLVSGSLPSGLALASNGAITGTPLTAQTTSFVVTVVDYADHAVNSGTLHLTISAIPALTLTGTCPTTPFPAGAAISIPVQASGGYGAYSYVVNNPTSLTYQPSTGTVVGPSPGPGTHTLSVRVTDSLSNAANFTCGFTVASPLGITGTCPTAPVVAGSPMTISMNATGGHAPYSWTVLSPAWLSLSSSSGTAATFAGTPPAAGPVSLSIRVSDASGSAPATLNCSLTVQPALQLTGTCPSTAFAAGSLVTFPVQATGGTGSYTYQVLSPSWMAYQASPSAVSGTPPGPGTYPVSVRVTDSAGNQATFNCSVTVTGTLTISGTCPTSGIAGTPLSFGLTVSGGLSAYSWTVLSPSWLSVTSTSGAAASFGGTPPSSGSVSVSIRVNDSFGSTPATLNCSFTVQTALQISGTCPTATFATGSIVSVPVQATGGSGGYTYQVLSPSWLTWQASAGAATGTAPSGGTYAVSVRVTDSSGAQATLNCSVSVASPLSISGTCPTLPVTGSLLTLTLSVAGGQSPYNWTVSAPSWLVLAANGGSTATFTGIPPGPGPVDISIGVTDAVGSTLTRFTCRPTVQGRLQLTGSCNTSPYVLGSRIDIPVQASGGTGNYTFQTVSPPWLTYQASSGSFGGAAPAAGSYSFSATTIDSSGAQASFSCAFTVAAPLTVSGVCPGSVAAEAPFGVALTAQGGVGPYTWTVLLPRWLSLRSNSGNSATFSGLAEGSGQTEVSVIVSDSVRSSPAAFSCRVNVEAAPKIEPLRIAATCPTTSFPAGLRVVIPAQITGGNGETRIDRISPAWLTYDPGRGEFSGVPPAAGTYNFSVLATEGTGLQATFGCSVIVAPQLTTVGTCPTSVGVGSELNLRLSAQGGTAPFKFTVVSPPWLQVKDVSGSAATLSGTAPSAGTADVVVRVTDAIGSSAATFNCPGVRISHPQLVIQTAAPGGGSTGGCPTAPLANGQSILLPFSVSGGSGNGYKWSVSPPTSWFRLTSATGPSTSVTGLAPGDGGQYNIVVSVTDDAGNTLESGACTVRTLPSLRIQASTLAPVVGENFLVTLVGSGGQGPYTWALVGPEWLTLSGTSGNNVSLSGIPPDANPFSCQITFRDGANSTPETFDCSATPRFPALSISAPNACPTTPLVFGQPFSAQLQAAGGAGNYSWSLSGPAWLTASPNGAVLDLSGSPSEIQEYNYSVELQDGAQVVAAPFTCTLRVIPPNIPSLTLVVAPGANLQQPVLVTLQLSGPSPIALTGQAVLAFTSTAFGITDNPQIQFVEPAGQTRQFTFRIPAQGTSVVLGRFQPGTVSGVISVAVTGLTGGGANLLTGRPSVDFTVPRVAPVLSNMAFESETADGFTIVITGFSTPRDLTSATFTVNPRGGAQLIGNTSFTIDLTETARRFYQSPESVEGGGTFVLRFPVAVSGSKGDVASVSVTFTNSAGQSNTISRDR